MALAYNYGQGITMIPMKGKPKMLTARQFAAAREVAYTTVINWLNKELLIGAEKQELAYGGVMWGVSGGGLVSELKTGAEPEAAEKGTKKDRKKKTACFFYQILGVLGILGDNLKSKKKHNF